MGGGIRRGPTPFRFENMWLKVDGFIDLLRGWWQGIEVRGRASFRLAYKMKLEYWDGVESERTLTLAEAEQKNKPRMPSIIGCFWKRFIGGRNLGSCGLRKGIGIRVTSTVWQMPHKLLSEEQGWRADIEGLQFKQLSSREADGLEVPFSVEEIHSALMEMGGDKAPGPDGFSVAFWQECWDFVKEEVVEMFKEFFEHGSFAKSLNTTFLVLIPKKGGAEDLRDFRPISLLGGLYKLLAKVLANRLKKVLDRVVSVDQNAFVRGRQILDASLVANEHQLEVSYEGSSEDGLWVSLEGLDVVVYFYCQILHINQWGSSWVLFEFKGVEARRPLSPYLFVLGMEVLSTLIRRAGEGGFISGCRLRGRGGEELVVSHLLFADDTLIFCEARREQLANLSWILAWFEAASGLRINLAKSVLIPGGEVDELEELAAELGCRLGGFTHCLLGAAPWSPP
ncbi:LINE-1 reverse transcriptase-like [Vitis vinifera]|uniref:LINE-1 reverse transcriptase-like n=1 Tax=Vitis vinifera TaxID=29760 RepID=A0A438J8M6_VITVI|nr:LINE-1 reverse transcriptase-like [Vitis vinifera]